MQNYIKSQTRLAFVQYIFQNEFLNTDSSDSIEDFQMHFYDTNIAIIDEKKELARLAAAKREALELYIEDLTKNLNALSDNKNELEAKLNKGNIALALAYDNLEQTQTKLTSLSDLNTILQSTISDLKKNLLDEEKEKEIFIKDLNQKNTILSEKEKELITSKILINKFKEDLKSKDMKLTETEKNLLIEKIALKNLREKLNESRAELELTTLSLEEERKRAIENLKLISSSEKAMFLLEENNLKLSNENNEIKSELNNKYK